MITFACPSCGKIYQVKEEFANRQTKCRECGHRLVVPSLETSRLISDLNHCDFAVRAKAMANLCKLKDVSAVGPLINLLTDRDSRVREEAAYSLECIGDPRAVDPLIVALSDVDGNVRLKAARALGKLKDVRAVQSLIVHLRDLDDAVRFYTAQALGAIGDKSALQPLKTALRHTSQSEARRAMEQAIAALEPQPGPALPSEPARGREAAKRLNDQQNFLAAIEADPSWAIPYCNQGREYFSQGKRDEARRCFRKAYELAQSRRNVGDDVVLQEISRYFRPELLQ